MRKTNAAIKLMHCAYPSLKLEGSGGALLERMREKILETMANVFLSCLAIFSQLQRHSLHHRKNNYLPYLQTFKIQFWIILAK